MISLYRYHRTFSCRVWHGRIKRDTGKIISRWLCTPPARPRTRHEPLGGKLSGVLEKPREVAFRNEPVPQSSPDDSHHRRGRPGTRPELGEEEVLPVYVERLDHAFGQVLLSGGVFRIWSVALSQEVQKTMELKLKRHFTYFFPPIDYQLTFHVVLVFPKTNNPGRPIWCEKCIMAPRTMRQRKWTQSYP